MNRSEIWRDVNDALRRAMNEGLHLLDEGDLVEQSDRQLLNLPIVGGTQPTTALLLRRYHAQLHQELCAGNRPRVQFTNLEEELRELTRGVLVTILSDEGTSVENAVLLALVLHKRGLATFCAVPPSAPTTI